MTIVFFYLSGIFLWKKVNKQKKYEKAFFVIMHSGRDVRAQTTQSRGENKASHNRKMVKGDYVLKLRMVQLR
jgi:hypothetical protein